MENYKWSQLQEPPLVIEPLGPQHDRAAFREGRAANGLGKAYSIRVNAIAPGLTGTDCMRGKYDVDE